MASADATAIAGRFATDAADFPLGSRSATTSRNAAAGPTLRDSLLPVWCPVATATLRACSR